MTHEGVLFLGPEASPLIAWLREQGQRVVQTAEPVSPAIVENEGIGWAVSYGYRHILRPDFLETLAGRAINLHISYLPWNRGADPNFWSFVDDTPKGVTIHYVDEGVDTGDILVQQELEFDVAVETLATSYAKLQEAIEALFRKHWHAIRRGACPRRKQVGDGSLHRSSDKEPLAHLLTDAWDTPVAVLHAFGQHARNS